MESLMSFHHIGVATKDIDSTLYKLKKFFEISNVTPVIFDENQDAYLCMVTLKTGEKIELINGKIVEKFLKKRQNLYHTCYEVAKLDYMIDELVEEGAFLISAPKPAKLFNGKRVAFLMWDLGIIELIEQGDN